MTEKTDAEMKAEIWKIACAKGIDIFRAKALYRKQLEESLAGFETQLSKDIAEETERTVNQLLEVAIEEVFTIVKEKFGVELTEDPESGEITIDNENILASIVAILKDLSPILAHPESHHVSIELTRASGEIWNVKIVNRAE